MLQKGLGGNVDEKKALELFHESAEKGYPQAQFKLGYLSNIFQNFFYSSSPILS